MLLRGVQILLYGWLVWMLLCMLVIAGASAAYEADSYSEAMSIEVSYPSDEPESAEEKRTQAIAKPIINGAIAVVGVLGGLFYPVSLVVPHIVLAPVLRVLPFLPLLYVGYKLYNRRETQSDDWVTSEQ